MTEPCNTQSLQVCGFRVARLNAAGFPIAGPGNGYVSKAPLDCTITLDYINGAELQQLNGCGTLNAFFHALNIPKQVTMTLQMTDLDPELITLLTTPDYSIITEGGLSEGLLFPAVGACQPSQQLGVSFEMFTKRWQSCQTPDDGLLYWQWVIPRAFLHITQLAAKNDFMPLPVTGYANANPNWGTGPFGDAPVAIGSKLGMVFPRADIPTAVCGLVTVPDGAPS